MNNSPDALWCMQAQITDGQDAVPALESGSGSSQQLAGLVECMHRGQCASALMLLKQQQPALSALIDLKG